MIPNNLSLRIAAMKKIYVLICIRQNSLYVFTEKLEAI